MRLQRRSYSTRRRPAPTGTWVRVRVRVRVGVRVGVRAKAWVRVRVRARVRAKAKVSHAPAHAAREALGVQDGELLEAPPHPSVGVHFGWRPRCCAHGAGSCRLPLG